MQWMGVCKDLFLEPALSGLIQMSVVLKMVKHDHKRYQITNLGWHSDVDELIMVIMEVW